jgi:hypothetical protein
MADPTCGEELCGRCTVMREGWLAVSDEEPYPNGKHNKIKKLMTRIR